MTEANYEGIAVLGSHPATVELAPFDDPKWKIYACSPHNYEHRKLPRWDAWFELHDPIADATRAYPYLRWLETHGECKENSNRSTPVWMRDKAAIGNFPTGKLIDEKALKDRFGPFTFTSSIAYMVAQAIVDAEREGIGAIGLWGIMQASENEYTYQRPGIQNLIWEATKSGMDVYAPDVSRLFEPQKNVW